ncbi:hypothetical protein SAMN05421504_104608 [Amycolatopsis xylanica]|uniref:Transglycosylase SLT domain-containing protein n=1 Tax=Amycolatopsis xylanica TaxID=589385 RepID=A0A1H3HD44_9PSEU|nr:hypothetical protein [Amycolatopsis xylanica]SDY13135.1 hypothetical protein SAMN05421504_104608 [Amycolatopsis xylanica]
MRRLPAVVLAATIGLTLASPSGQAAAAPPAQGALAAPDAALDKDWRASGDVLVTGAGDTDGFHLYVAREKEAFAWKKLATLKASALPGGSWFGHVCLTGSGKHAVAVFAPAMAANKPKLVQAGAIAAVVDVETGKAREIATGLSTAYFNPACGPGDRVLLTRGIGDDGQQTDLLAVDAASAKVLSTRRIGSQFTTPAAAPDGDYGMALGNLVKVGDDGTLTPVARPQGRVFAVNATAKHGIDIASVNADKAYVQRLSRDGLSQLASGPWDKLQIFGLTGGRTAVVGDTRAVATSAPGLVALASDRQVRGTSAEGHLLATEVLTRQTERKGASPLAAPDRADAGSLRVAVRATKTGKDSTGTVTATPAPTLDAIAAKTADGPNLTNPTCAVGRNDPRIQAFQPSEDMVEWAVDQAVHGTLNVQRPANYLKAGQGAYTPQGMFPLRSLAGGGTVPAQLMLGILAQETNLAQGSWHVVPGDTGNPLVADYYGNHGDGQSIDYGGEGEAQKTDCGYGIGQVTTGMRVADGDSVYNRAQQLAIATDYAANIAAGLNILIEKWNQLYNDPAGRSYVNNGDPTWIEDWWLAVWAYNSGYYPSTKASQNGGYYGVGYLNNPANPQYPANRAPFLRLTYADAERPSEWSYPERVMGWVESPQLKGTPSHLAYSKPVFGESKTKEELTVATPKTFCDSRNNCDPAVVDQNKPLPKNQQTSPCAAFNSSCWWHGQVSFAGCILGECAKEKVTFGAGTPEPGVKRIYPRDCSTFPELSKPRAKIVFDLNDTSQYALGCSVPASNGKFTLRTGDPSGNHPEALYAQVDLHQAGAGYNGHMWFTHTYRPDYLNGTSAKHKITGTWTPDLDITQGSVALYDIWVHLPSHGGETEHAEYVVMNDDWNQAFPSGGGQKACTIDQDTSPIGSMLGSDQWKSLGTYALQPGARVMLNNMESDYAIPSATVDIAFDAMAFVPASATAHPCGQTY